MDSTFVSLDTETLGVGPNAPIIELGVVMADWMAGKTLNAFHSYVIHGSYDNCEPYAMSMHPIILRRIATREPGWRYTHIDDLALEFQTWLNKCGNKREKLVVAGKNVANFDLPRLSSQCKNWDSLIKIHRRVMDPSMLFWHPNEDELPPGLSKCQERSGQDSQVKHTALEDAMSVAQMIFVAVGRRLSPIDFFGE